MQFLLVVILSFSVSAKESSMIWGKIIRSEGVSSYKYFMTYESDGKFHAYPIDTPKKEIAKLIEKNLSQLVRLKGEFKTVKVVMDGPPKEIPVFTPESVSPLMLTDLKVDGPGKSDSTPNTGLQKKKEEYNGGGITINDKLANRLIITTGALMIGSAILNSINKK